MLNANEIKFGVEIETVAPRNLVTIGRYHNPIQVPFLPEGWKASSDCSIEAPYGYEGCEIVSPILKGIEGLKQIETVCNELKARGFKVNHSCGVHVSVDWGRHTDSKTTERLIVIVAHMERAIYATTGTHRREEGHWCQSVNRFDNRKNAMEALDNSRHSSRYHILNLTNLHMGQDRVEFRAFSESLNATKISGWVQLCVGIVQKAKSSDRLPSWNARTNDHMVERFGGAGQREVFRIFTYLGWYKSFAHGKPQYGVMMTESEMKPVIKMMKAMAKKYDEAA